MHIARFLVLALVLWAPLACTVERRAPEVVVDAIDALPSPAGAGSAEPNLAVASDGAVVLSWLEPQPDSTVALRFAILRDGRWSPAGTIARGPAMFANWADFPSILALANGDLLAHWMERTGSERYAYDALVSRSRDGGATWSAGEVLHTHRGPAEHGFVSLWPTGDSSASAVWLDGRNAPAGSRGGSMMLLHRELTTDGFGVERVVDSRVCDCCQTSAAVTARGPVVVYRDRSPGEVRDIAIARLTSTGWTEPRRVHADEWRIEACPVNGPAVAAAGEQVAVAWFTAARDTARVQVAFSSDAGETFSAPTRVDDGAPAGRVAIVLDGSSGGAFVSWIERTGGEAAEVRVRHVARDGSVGEPEVVAASSAARASGFPRMARAGDDIIFAWTAPGDPSTVRLARGRVERPR